MCNVLELIGNVTISDRSCDLVKAITPVRESGRILQGKGGQRRGGLPAPLACESGLILQEKGRKRNVGYLIWEGSLSHLQRRRWGCVGRDSFPPAGKGS